MDIEYETEARPIRTAEELEAAINAGAHIEFTACADCPDPDTYDMPPSHIPDSGGWVISHLDECRMRADKGQLATNCYLHRAFYPVMAEASK